jgi:PAS domain S-box-containing protein
MTDPRYLADTLRLAAIVESSDDAIIGKDLNGIVTSWNRAAERIFGYTADEMIGRSVTTIIPLERIDEEHEVLTRIRSGNSVDHFETVRRRKDGTLVPISLTVSPIRTPDGIIIGASKIARDISERRRAQEALAAAEARQRDLQQHLIALVAASRVLFESPSLGDVLSAIVAVSRSLVAADGYLVWWLNSARQRWQVASSTGLSSEFVDRMTEIVERDLESLEPLLEPIAVEDVAEAPSLVRFQEAYAAEKIASLLAVPLATEGAHRAALVFYYHVRRKFDAADVQIGQALANLAGAAITTAELYDEQRRSRDEATSAYRQASIASRAKDEFLATLSHELRTPLNAVLGWTRMLQSGTLAPARVSRAVEVIERNANAQLRLIEDMLDMSRVITGTLRLDVKAVRLADAVSAAVETTLPAARAKGIAINVQSDDSDIVMGDGARLQQVVWNLLSNAVKFTPRGGLISVRIWRDSSSVEMEVKDTGQGIDREVLPFVFDRFRQGDSGTTRTHSGLGLGLAIVRHIVEMHGGHVTVTSEGNGKGSTFHLTLPAAAQREHDDFPLPLREPGVVASPTLVGKRALVIDDDPDSRELITRMLQMHGMVVEAAGSAGEGLAALDREVPDIIVSDLAMPERDGYDLIRRVRERPAQSGGLVPAIAVTAFARPEDTQRSIAAGFQLHLTKPLDPIALFYAVERLAVDVSRHTAG